RFATVAAREIPCATKTDEDICEDSTSTAQLRRAQAVFSRVPIKAAVSMGRRNTKPEVYLQESQELNSFTSVESYGTLPWLAFRRRTSRQIGSVGEVASDRLIRCCGNHLFTSQLASDNQLLPE